MADNYTTDEAQPSSSNDTGDDAEARESLNQKIIDQAKDCFKLAVEAESEIRALAEEDMEFSVGKQWPNDVQQDRDRDGRPCLVINRIPQFVQQITNEQRQNRPSVKVHPVNDGADEDTAKIIQGLIRHIEYNSNAEVAYDTATESAVRGGFGYWRVLTDFVAPDSFDQEIYIKRVKNPFSVYLDPSSQEPDGSDAKWALVVDYLTRDDYKSQYPDSDLAASNDWESIGNRAPDWMKGSTVAVVEYLYKEYVDKTIHLLSTGETVEDEELFERLTSAAQAGIQSSVVQSRQTKIPVIKWVKLNAVEVLETTTWPGKYIPIVPVYGNEIYINGKKILEGIVRHAKDPQRMYNYWASAETEAIALAPKAPFIGSEGQFEGHEEKWATANRRNHAYLEYKPTSLNGQPQPPPQRQSFEPAVQAITQARMMSAEDLKATTGIYDSAVGAQSNEISGVAIQSRSSQSQTSNFHFVDNLKRSIRHTGRILVDLIPRIYDSARTARIVGDDGTHQVVKLNQAYTDNNGKPLLYKLDSGTYDVTVDSGPSFASKRQEAATAMQEMTRVYPQLMQIAGDLMVKNMDWPGAEEIADRIRKTLPPALQADPKGPQPLPPQVQAQMQQMHQLIQNLSNELNETTKIIETKKLDIESKERIELMKVQSQLEIEAAKLGSKEDMALLNHQIGEIEKRLSFLQMSQPIDTPQDFNPQAADGGNYAGFGHVGSGPTGGESPGNPMEGT